LFLSAAHQADEVRTLVQSISRHGARLSNTP
jgi:hypothetical protein